MKVSAMLLLFDVGLVVTWNGELPGLQQARREPERLGRVQMVWCYG